MSDVSTPLLILIFAVAAVATWIAGVRLAKATDILDEHFGLGEAIGGMILLSIVGSLPELAITVSAASSGHLGMAAGNLIGGVAMQTLVLVIADRCIRGKLPLSSSARSLVPALEGMLVIAVVGITVMSALLPEDAAIGSLGVGEIGILVTWVIGILVLNKVRNRKDLDQPLREGEAPPPPLPAAESGAVGVTTKVRGTMILFGVLAFVTLGAGVVLEQAGNQLADNWGINGVLFGATILAAATALPEISTGIAAVRLQRYTLVFGDMFGGNAFQLTLFVVADLVAGQAVLPAESGPNAWIGMVGLVMTAMFVAGIILRPQRRYAKLGPDSWAALAVYLLGLWGFVVISQ